MPSILNPETTVALSCGTVTVRELRRKDATLFLVKLGAAASAYITKDADGTIRLNLDLSKLTELITQSDELANFLAARSSGLTYEQIGELSMSEFLTLLNAALELNLSDDLLAIAKKTAGLLAKAVPGTRTQTGPQASTSSSPKDTPATT